MDIATTSGFCLWDGEKFNTQTFRANVKKSILDNANSLDAAREGEIVRKFEDFVLCWLVESKAEFVGIEQPIPSNTTRRKLEVNAGSDWAGKSVTYKEAPGTSQAAIFRIYSLEGAAASVCNRLNIPVVFVPQGTWRKTFLGNGRPSNAKQEAVKMCRRLGIEIASVDAAEAVGVCYHLVQEKFPQNRRLANDLFSGKQTITAAQYREEAERLFQKPAT